MLKFECCNRLNHVQSNSMSSTAAILIASIAAYAVGSVPFAFLVAKFTLGIDIRQQGSGNVGATNVARVLGAKWGILVLLLDCLKGLLPVLLLPLLLLAEESPEIGQVQVASGLAAVLGHIFPCWLGFRGGKGVATLRGAFGLLVPVPAAVGTGVLVVTAAVGCMMSLASLLGSMALVVTAWLRDEPSYSVAAALLAAIVIVWRHRENIRRITRGEEAKLGGARS